MNMPALTGDNPKYLHKGRQETRYGYPRNKRLANTRRQRGVVLVLSLLMLVSLTILGVSAVTSSLMQNKMAVSMESQSLAFDAAEAAIAAVAFESEDQVLLGADVLTDPLSQARQGNQLDPDATDLSCFDNSNWTGRTLTESGLTAGSNHTVAGNYNAQPEVQSWSRTAFVTEQSCLGSSNVQGGSNISCHIFLIRGCGQLSGSSYAVANTLNASTFAPAAD
jgi:type IV pilus assembly protein PilX